MQLTLPSTARSSTARLCVANLIGSMRGSERKKADYPVWFSTATPQPSGYLVLGAQKKLASPDCESSSWKSTQIRSERKYHPEPKVGEHVVPSAGQSRMVQHELVQGVALTPPPPGEKVEAGQPLMTSLHHSAQLFSSAASSFLWIALKSPTAVNFLEPPNQEVVDSDNLPTALLIP
ncbi:hypothetical protein C8R44DRAFT_724916 [Mycena epipterygia]|nr:hypothetical protein C8R44DRAFT_724916 [Mycena epipterygia]